MCYVMLYYYQSNICLLAWVIHEFLPQRHQDTKKQLDRSELNFNPNNAIATKTQRHKELIYKLLELCFYKYFFTFLLQQY